MKSIAISAIILLSSICLYGAGPLRVAFVGDPQVDNGTELEYARKSIYSELRKRTDIDFAVFLGDLVNDNTGLLCPTVQTLDSLPFPWFSVPGNHDRDVYKEKGRIRDLYSYTVTVGAPDTSFVRNGIRFILMNNVRHSRKSEYEGGFTQKGKDFIKGVLKDTPSKQPIVFATHIPLSWSKGLDSLTTMLRSHSRIIFVGGHTHSVSRHSIERQGQIPVHEIIAGAACGSWWRGEKGPDGIPSALQNCGAPRGYFIADFKKSGKYRLEYKVIGSDEAPVSAYISKDSLLYVNIFGGSTEGRTTVRIKDSRRHPAMEALRTEAVAPEVARTIESNKALTREERRARRDEFIPLRKIPSPHIWTVRYCMEIPENTFVEIRYRDRNMKIHTTVPLRNL